MARLEDITKGTRLSGLSGPGIATVESVQWSGTQALKVIFRQADSQLGERLLYRVSFFGLAFFIGKKWMKPMMEKKKDDDVEST